MRGIQKIAYGGTGLRVVLQELALRCVAPDEFATPIVDIIIADPAITPTSRDGMVFHALKNLAPRVGIPQQNVRLVEADNLERSLAYYCERNRCHTPLMRALYTHDEWHADTSEGFHSNPKVGAGAMALSRATPFIADVPGGVTIASREIVASAQGGTGTTYQALARHHFRTGPNAGIPGRYGGLDIKFCLIGPYFNPELGEYSATDRRSPSFDQCLQTARGALNDHFASFLEVAVKEALAERPDEHRAAFTQFLFAGPDLDEARRTPPPIVRGIEDCGGSEPNVQGFLEHATVDQFLRRCVFAVNAARRPWSNVRSPGGVRFDALHCPPSTVATFFTGSEDTGTDVELATMQRAAGIALEQLASIPYTELTRTWGIERLDCVPKALGAFLRGVCCVERNPEEVLEAFKGELIRLAETSESAATGATMSSLPFVDYDVNANVIDAAKETLLPKLMELATARGNRNEREQHAIDAARLFGGVVRQHCQRQLFPYGDKLQGFAVPDESWRALVPSVRAQTPDGLGTSSLASVSVEDGLVRVERDRFDELLEYYPSSVGVHSHAYAHPLGTVSALSDAVRRKGRAFYDTREGRCIVTLWRAKLHSKLAFVPPTSADRRVLERAEMPSAARDIYVLKYRDVTVGFTSPELGFVPHVELVDANASESAYAQCVRDTFARLEHELEKVDEPDDKVALRQFIQQLPSEVWAARPRWLTVLEGYTANVRIEGMERLWIPSRRLCLVPGIDVWSPLWVGDSRGALGRISTSPDPRLNLDEQGELWFERRPNPIRLATIHEGHVDTLDLNVLRAIHSEIAPGSIEPRFAA